MFAAARRPGIRNVVWASSETVLGAAVRHAAALHPVDEEYPARPETAYSLAKHLEEQMADQFCRWDPELKMIGLRFSNVMDPEDYAEFPAFDADPLLRKWNLWGYIDARDGAQAVRRALEHQATGAGHLHHRQRRHRDVRPNAELVAEVFPGVRSARELGEHETLLSIDKARRVLGYEPAAQLARPRLAAGLDPPRPDVVRAPVARRRSSAPSRRASSPRSRVVGPVAMPTCEAPGPSVSKNTRSPAWIRAVDRRADAELRVARARERDARPAPNAHCVRPEQSKPPWPVPP